MTDPNAAALPDVRALIEKALALDATATPGPWEAVDADGTQSGPPKQWMISGVANPDGSVRAPAIVLDDILSASHAECAANAAFIAEARALVPALAEALEATLHSRPGEANVRAALLQEGAGGADPARAGRGGRSVTNGIIYLAAPYSSPEPAVRLARYEAVTKAAARLVAAGEIVFSPLTMTHPLDVLLADEGATLGSAFWVRFDEAFMEACSEIRVLKLDGWDRSSGIARELAFFRERNRPVSFIEDEAR